MTKITVIVDDGQPVSLTTPPAPTTDTTQTSTLPVIASPTGLILVPEKAAAAVTLLDNLDTWLGEKDGDTPGTAQGLDSALGTEYPVTIGGRTARKFAMKYTAGGGFRWHTVYGNDPFAKNFVFGGDLWFDSIVGLGQMELDNNQVMPDRQTVIYGCQCDSNSNAWDVSSVDSTGRCAWHPTSAQGSPANFQTGKWLHFEIAAHRDDNGNVIYDAIHFDGTTMQVNAQYVGRAMLEGGKGWDQVLLVNVQVDGLGDAGTITLHASGMKVARW